MEEIELKVEQGRTETLTSKGIIEQREAMCRNKRNNFLSCLKYHFDLMKINFVEHKKLLDRIFVLATKLIIFESDERPKNLPYSKELIWKVRGEILQSINSIVSKINQNLKQLSSSFISLRRSHEEFVISSKGIDWDSNSYFNNGSATEKPLIFYVKYSFDIMYCLHFYEKSIQIKNKQLHFNIRDTDSITTFLKAIPISQYVNDLITDVLLNSHFIDKAERRLGVGRIDANGSSVNLE